MKPRFKPISDHALLVTFADTVSHAAHASVPAFDRHIAQTPAIGMIKTVTALVNLLVLFAPIATDHPA